MRFLALLLLCGVSLASACTTDEDCSLNGLCTGGTCACDPSWRGEDCGVLNLLPGPLLTGYNRIADGISTWGGSVHQDPNNASRWVIYSSEFINYCGLNDWSPNSRVIKAEASSYLGPFTFVEEILGTFHHNPQVTKAVNADGSVTWLMTVIGRPCNNTANCSAATGARTTPILDTAACPIANSSTPGNMESGISLYSAPTLDGPWTQVGDGYALGDHYTPGWAAWDADTTNPSPYILPSGLAIMMYRGCGFNCDKHERIGIAIANSWDSEFKRITGDAPLCGRSDDTCDNEDPFIYQDSRGNFHLLMHYLGKGGGFGGGPNIGSHAFSRDALDWTFSNTTAFNTTVNFEDGSSIDLNRRERPQLVFGPDGITPLALSSGAQARGTGRSYNIIVPVNH